MDQVTTQKLMADLKIVMADVEELLRATANQTGERIAAARTRVEASLQVAKLRLANAQAALVETAKTTDEYVHANPWKAVGLAAAFGFLFGVLSARR